MKCPEVFHLECPRPGSGTSVMAAAMCGAYLILLRLIASLFSVCVCVLIRYV